MRINLRRFCAMTAVAVVGYAGNEGLRRDRISLAGTWKFQLRHDNRLLTTSSVSFGPVLASSSEPAAPWALSTTLLGSHGNLVWKPNAKQQGPTWWRADLGIVQPVSSVWINWARPNRVSIVVETSKDGASWTPWAKAESNPDDIRTELKATTSRCRYVRLTFEPSQFQGTRQIEIYTQNRRGSVLQWQPEVRRSWYDELRKFEPADGFQLVAFDDSRWESIRVPAAWELQKPEWNDPDDSASVGYYRHKFNVPEQWRDRAVKLRFEAANNSVQVWINGKQVGYHEGGLLPFEMDVSNELSFGAENLIAIRVAKRTLTSTFDHDDAWFPGGLWRDVYLYSFPATRIEDFTARTELDSQYRDAVLRVTLKLRTNDWMRGCQCVVEGSLFDREGRQVALEGFQAQLTIAGRDAIAVELTAEVKDPHKWTAETPYLYSLALRLKSGGRTVQEFKTAIGIRQVEVKGYSLLLNGIPIKLRGAVTTRSNPTDADETWDSIFHREIRLLKEGNLNTLRAHTTPLEEDFLDLCDRFGIYIIPDVPHTWIPESDFRYQQDEMLQRTREMYEMHKNHPSVIAYHVGNENPPTTGYLGQGRAAWWLHETDPTRPVAICSNMADRAELKTDFSDMHYPDAPDLDKSTSLPVLFGEFHSTIPALSLLKDAAQVEAWGRTYDDEWKVMLEKPWVLGALTCCWDDGSGDHNGGGQYGLVNSKRQPKTLHYYVRKAFSPVRLRLDEATVAEGRLKAALNVTNQFNFIDLEGFEFKWELRGAGKVLRSGIESYPVAPGAASRFPFDVEMPAGAEKLRLNVFDADGFSIEEEEFNLPASRTTASVAGLLQKLGIAETGPIAVQNAVVRTGSYRADWTPEGRVRVRGRDRRELFSSEGIVLDEWVSGMDLQRVGRFQNWAVNAPVALGRAECGAASVQAKALVFPFTIAGKTTLGKPVNVDGTIRVEFGRTWIRFTYEFQTKNELTIHKSGLGLRLSGQFEKLSWNRTSLWRVTPDDWIDRRFEEQVPLSRVRGSISRRNLIWSTLEGAEGGLFIEPLGHETNLSIAEGPTVVFSDYMGATVETLSTFPKVQIERKFAAGERFGGGFTVHILTSGQLSKLHRLSEPEKDLTWNK